MKIELKNKKISLYDYNTFFKKLKGLMFVKRKINYAIRLNNCNSIHTFFMFQKIDVCMTDKDNNILYKYENLKPNSIILPKKNVYYVYEMPQDSIKLLNNKIKIR